MREIKFRAWVINTMIYNIPLNKDGTYSHCVSHGFALQYDPQYITISDVMQYTGLKDIDGKEIWEGDILTNLVAKWGVVFNTGCFAARILPPALHEQEMHLALRAVKGVKVIGNIHENPELL
jgi:hypothetical protein